MRLNWSSRALRCCAPSRRSTHRWAVANATRWPAWQARIASAMLSASCRSPASSRRTTHVVDPLPERVRLVAAPGGLRDVELPVLGWRTEAGELTLRCRLLDGSSGTIPARWTDLAPCE